ncbi:histidine phosphotransferase [Gelatoporia subvermispora B]|uniref:Histidine phosphotransferase n=1 Tax=Ceriporiopsis subvermispora (strain B) TaxID=914234 RepID=M2QRN1_CERS8|nr:histidine phosphotransferase [Gelatoporia subvermispora B]
MSSPAPLRAGSLDPPRSPARSRATLSPEPSPPAVRTPSTKYDTRAKTEPPTSRAAATAASDTRTRQASVAPSESTDGRATPAEDDDEPATPSVKDDAADAEPIDFSTFTQILDLDEDDTHDFSESMVQDYFKQAKQTFSDMDKAFDEKDLSKLSSLGHFLKGSSAALGIVKVQASCEQIQHYGQKHDDATGAELEDVAALGKIGPLLRRVRKEYAVAEHWLKDWYRENGGGDPED